MNGSTETPITISSCYETSQHKSESCVHCTGIGVVTHALCNQNLAFVSLVNTEGK